MHGQAVSLFNVFSLPSTCTRVWTAMPPLGGGAFKAV